MSIKFYTSSKNFIPPKQISGYALPGSLGQLSLPSSVGIAGGLGVSTPVVHVFNPPSLIYSFGLGGQKITPQDRICTHCFIIIAQILSHQ